MNQPTVEQVAMLPMTHEATIPVDYLDAMGHMNVMWYTHLFSGAMIELFARCGVDQRYVEQTNSGTFAIEKHVRYLAEVRVGQHVSLYTRAVARTAKRLHVILFMVNDATGQLSATMENVATHVDLSIRRSSPFPDAVADALDKFVVDHGALDWQPPLCGVMGA